MENRRRRKHNSYKLQGKEQGRLRVEHIRRSK
jgi:hypothetical protein